MTHGCIPASKETSVGAQWRCDPCGQLWRLYGIDTDRFWRRTEDPIEERPKFIAPYLPKTVAFEVRQHEAQRKLVVHHLLEAKEGECQNCAGEGILYLCFLGAGPAKVPITSKHPSTWLGKSERNGEGWFVIERTQGYLCLACQGEMPIPKANIHRKADVREGTAEVVAQRSMPRGDA